jgi:uncharacterized protein (DUF433 family)
LKVTVRVTARPDVYHGQACVKGTRIPVFHVLRMMANGDSVETLLREFPNLEREDIFACLG